MKQKVLYAWLSVILLGSLVAAACAREEAGTPAAAPAATPIAVAPAAATPVPASTETVSWMMNWGAEELSADGAAFKPGGRFEELLLDKSGGRFKVVIRQGMFPAEQRADAIATDKVQIGDAAVTYIAGTYPLLDFGALPFRFSSLYQYEKAVLDPEMAEILNKVYRDMGLQYLSQVPAGAMKYVYAKKPLTAVADFKGLKLRVTGKAATLSFQLLGASPVSVPGPEMADALYRGVVDAAVTTLDYGIRQGLADMAKYLSEWQVMPLITTTFVANAKAFDALPPDLQQVLLETAADISRQQYYAAEPEDEAFKFVGEILELNFPIPSKEEVLKARELTKPVVDDWLAIAGPYGPKVLEISAKYLAK